MLQHLIPHSFIFIYLWGCSGTEYIITAAYGDDCGAVSGMVDWQGKLKHSEETCPSAALSTIDPT
jgi:hypothetical protein